MLYQIHHQFKDGSNEFCAQNEFDYLNFDQKKFNDWISEVRVSHPLPAGAKFMICNEASSKFLWAVGKKI